MSELNTDIELDFEQNGKPGAGTLRVICGDDVLANEHVDLLDRERRESLIGRLCDGRPGIDRETLTCELLRLSARPTIPRAKPKRPVPQWEPFPVEWLPVILRDFIETGARSMGCDPSMIALPAIATIAGAVGTTRQVHLKGTWYEYPIFWTAVVARSGTLKSPALDYAARTLRQAQQKRIAEFDAAMTEFERAALQYDADVLDWKRKPRKGAERDEPPKKPIPPACVRYIVSDATVESLVPILRDNPRGVLLLRDELGAWLQSINQYKGGKGADLQNWLEMFRGRPVIVDRKTHGMIQARRAAVSVCGTVQPGMLARLLTAEYFEAGLSARLLLAAPPPELKRWTDATPDADAVEAFGAAVMALTALEHEPDGGSVALGMTADARAAFVTFYDAFAVEQFEADDDAMAASFAKIEGYVARLALVFALTDDPHAAEIGVGSMRSAITVGRWFARESQRVYGMLRETTEEREDSRLVEWIRNRGGSVTVRKLRQGLRRYRNNADAAATDLDRLAQAGLGSWDYENGGSAGAPSKRFRLSENPSANRDNDNETTSNATKNEGSVDVVAVDAWPSADNGGPSIDPEYAHAPGAEADSARKWGET